MAHTVPETQISQSQVVLPIRARWAAIDLAVLSQTEGNRVTASTQPARGGWEHPAWRICPGPCQPSLFFSVLFAGVQGHGVSPHSWLERGRGAQSRGQGPGEGAPQTGLRVCPFTAPGQETLGLRGLVPRTGPGGGVGVSPLPAPWGLCVWSPNGSSHQRPEDSLHGSSMELPAKPPAWGWQPPPAGRPGQGAGRGGRSCCAHHDLDFGI